MSFAVTKKWGFLDFKVWITFIILAILSMGLLAYKVATNKPCPIFSIQVNGKLNHNDANKHTYYVNEQLDFFTTLRNKNSSVVWDFDDGTDKKSGSYVIHTYLKEGYYLVKAIVDGQCLQSFNVRITQSPSVVNSVAPVISPIISADIISVGDEANFTTSAIGANYEWSVDEIPNMPKQTTNPAKFIFTQPGDFNIVLKVDEEKVYKKLIQVIDNTTHLAQAPALPPVSSVDVPPAPQTPLPTPDKTEEIKPQSQEPAKQEPELPPAKVYDQLPEPAIKAMLQGVIDGNKEVNDFDNILCNGAGTKVMANNKSTTFAALCNELKDKKGILILKRKRKIESFKVVRDETNGNCVKIINIKYK